MVQTNTADSSSLSAHLVHPTSLERIDVLGPTIQFVTDVFHVPGGAKHAFRNTGSQEAVMMIASTARLGRFFRELGAPITPGSPPPEPLSADRVQRFLATSARYGYWNASPEENARVGIELPF